MIRGCGIGSGNMKLKDVLELCEVKGKVVELPDIELERNLFNEVNKYMKSIGGRYNPKAKGFVFIDNPPAFF